MQAQSGNATRTEGNSSAARAGANLPIGQSVRPAQSTLGLVGELIDELATLFRHEVALARAEVRESVRAATAGLIHVAMGALILFTALLTGVAAGVLLLALILPAWLAALAIGAVTGAIGYRILRGGWRKLDVSNLKPTRARESLRKDAAILARRHRL
jgi:Putative Actinobacterial Holin-X, holin superfamily III